MKFLTLCCALFLLTLTSSFGISDKKGTKAAYKAVGDKGFDAANTIVPCNDGNFVLLGRTNSYTAGDMNMSAIKVDANGSIIWNKNYGAEESEEAYSGVQLEDEGFLFVGYSDSYGAGTDIKDAWVVRTDKSGVRVWDKTYGSEQSIDEAVATLRTEDNHYLVLINSIPIATGKSDILLLKIDEQGEVVWQQRYGGKTSEQAHSIAKTSEGYVIAGNLEGGMARKWDMLLISVDEAGNKQWEKTYGGADNEMGNVVEVMPSGKILLGGYSYTYAEGSHDAWVVCTDQSGKELWNKNFGGLSTDEFFDIVLTKEDQIVMVGYTDIYEADEYGNNVSTLSNEALIIKLDDKGNKLWQKTLGGAKDQVARAGAMTQDGGFVVAGYTSENLDERNMDMLILKVSANGQ